MRVPASDAAAASKSEKSSKAEKPDKKDRAEKSSVVTKKKAKDKDEDEAGPGAPAGAKAAGAAEVVLSPKGKAMSQGDRDIKQAETLMDQVDGGKLPDGDREKAMKRIGEVLKKYGQA